MSRPRFRLRTLMLIVAVVAVVIAGVQMWARSNASYHAARRQKYERAASYPWLAVEPDPPRPE